MAGKVIANDWLMVADGERLTKEKLNALIETRRVIACDGAAAYLLSLNIVPDCVIGDMDSLCDSAAQSLKSKGCELIHKPDQSSCDSHKALTYLSEHNAQTVLLAGVFGDRFDHSWCNLNLLRSFKSHFRALSIVRASEKIHLIEDGVYELFGEPGARVALLGFYEAVISTRGLLYDVADHLLGEQGVDSTSNRLQMNKAKLNIRGSVLLSIDYPVSLKQADP